MNKSTNLLDVAEVSIVYKNNVPAKKKIQIKSSVDIHKLMKPILQDVVSHHEEFWIVLLDQSNHVMGISEIAKGGITETTTDIRIIYQTALKANSVKLCLVHNHPSGCLTPSPQDLHLTKRIVEAGRLMSIMVIDHIIITENSYFSFADEGLL